MSEDEYIIEAYGMRIPVTREQYYQHQANTAANSHESYMADRPNVLSVDERGVVTNHHQPVMTEELTDPATAKQGMRRKAQLTTLLEQTVMQRKELGSGVKHESMQFEVWVELRNQHAACMKDEGLTPEAAANRVGFLPLNFYVHKLVQTRRDGSTRTIRPVVVNELGVRPNGTIVILGSNPGESRETAGNIVVGASRKS